jgi:hypothetical protein
MMDVREYAVSGLCLAFLALLQLSLMQTVLAQPDPVPAGRNKIDSESEVKAHLRAELRILLMDLVQSGAFGGVPPEQISLSLDAPAERTFDLGVLVDSSSGSAARDGLVVLGTTPGSLASRLGLRSGDILAGINSVSLANLGDDPDGAARAARVLRDSVATLPDGAMLHFHVARGRSMLELEGKITSIVIPAVHLRLGESNAGSSSDVETGSKSGAGPGCGRVSIFDGAPRQKQFHGVTLISIDGERSPMSDQVSVRLPAGRHELKVGERIDARYLGFSDRFRARGGNDRYKTLTIDIAANTTYFLAAHLNSEHLNEWRNGAYWEPVVWSTSREACR